MRKALRYGLLVPATFGGALVVLAADDTTQADLKLGYTNVQVFQAKPEAQTWEAPELIQGEVDIQAWAAGGGGAGGGGVKSGNPTPSGGGGGASGAVAQVRFVAHPGDLISIAVGRRGDGSAGQPAADKVAPYPRADDGRGGGSTRITIRRGATDILDLELPGGPGGQGGQLAGGTPTVGGGGGLGEPVEVRKYDTSKVNVTMNAKGGDGSRGGSPHHNQPPFPPADAPPWVGGREGVPALRHADFGVGGRGGDAGTPAHPNGFPGAAGNDGIVIVRWTLKLK